jgi:hypothetical protein
MKVPTSGSSDSTNGKPFLARPDAAPPPSDASQPGMMDWCDICRTRHYRPLCRPGDTTAQKEGK